MPCKTNIKQITYDELCSKVDMKKRLVKNGVNVKKARSHLDKMTTCSMVEDITMFELFEKDVDKVKFPLESPTMFLPKDGALKKIKLFVPMKHADSSVTDQNIRSEDAMSFL